MAQRILCACCKKDVPEGTKLCPSCGCPVTCDEGHPLGEGSETHLYCR